MADMRLGGIDPSILRELSGVYKPFVKAFKELISNAFDADAERVVVTFAEDFARVSVKDDGNGMNPFEFRNDFTRIGGGSRRWAGDKTRLGRERIGSKGIGFLALARYCDHLRVESSAPRSFTVTTELAETPGTVDVFDLLGVPIEPEILRAVLAYEVHTKNGKRKKLKADEHYAIQKNLRKLHIREELGAVEIKLTVDCSQLAFKAVLDFDKLLRLADQADLENLDDFASIEVYRTDTATRQSGSTITADNLKTFVRRELRAERRKGFVRNVSSQSGYEQFLWSLSRCTPIPYAIRDDINQPVKKLLANASVATLGDIEVRHGEAQSHLRRSVFPMLSETPPVPDDMLFPISINEGGLKVSGFLAGYESLIFPAEYRGVAIRVRGVSIGDPGYLGAETFLTGASRAALSQVTGEVIVERGLDAVDTLNPGRESFYEESEQYKILRRHLVGDGERVGGCLNKAITAVLRRSQVRSALADALGKVSLRRKALEDVSSAIGHLIAGGGTMAEAVSSLLKSRRGEANGLSKAPDIDMGIPARVGKLQVVTAAHQSEAAQIDYSKEQVTIDSARPEWSWSLLLFNRTFTVVHKKGQPHQPIAEIDFKTDSILVNWGHPVKLQMDERGFLRTALAWVLAKEAGNNNPTQMMDLALRLLAFTAHTDG